MNKIVFYNLFCFTLSWGPPQRRCKFMYYFPSGQYMTKSIENILKYSQKLYFYKSSDGLPCFIPEKQVMWLYN